LAALPIKPSECRKRGKCTAFHHLTKRRGAQPWSVAVVLRSLAVDVWAFFTQHFAIVPP